MIHLLLNTPPDAAVGNCTNDELLAMAATGVPLIDIRRSWEWEETGVIAGSHLITFFDDRNRYDLDAWLAAFDQVAPRTGPFILVCRRGIRTFKLGRYLDGRTDFRQVHHLHHGISGWTTADRAVVHPDVE